MTLHDIIIKFVDLRDKLTMKSYKEFSELCEAGEDKQRLIDISKSQDLFQECLDQKVGLLDLL